VPTGTTEKSRIDGITAITGARKWNVFFYEQLQPIGNWLENPPPPDAVWAEAVLDSTQRLAFDKCRVGKDAKENAEHEQNGNRHGCPQQDAVRRIHEPDTQLLINRFQTQ
jgi:hypothetical protein